MDVLLALLMWAIIILLYLQRQKCIREGRPFFRAVSKNKVRKPIKTSAPQRFQQKTRQRADNTPKTQRFKNRPQQVATASTKAQKPIKTSAPQRSQQKTCQRADNTPKTQRFKNRPQQVATASTKAQKPIKTSAPQRSQQKTCQRADNTSKTQRFKNRPNPGINKIKTETAKVATSKYKSSVNRENSVNRQLLNKLDSLTHDSNTSVRLIKNAKQKNPGQSLDWCAEQAIFQIQRDRK
ncbi:hypothetical protein [Adonisia turfae]|uniref:Uncharacterized protein n=1 Tax=Adonisia turfae CCMR0081 TaxID=2292702 RepID=A0A6M0RD05_9CYAN|nr:hypothetical protein [Adonisia turfae]NEZ54238.1 hypothetical protein [Adonisia turfae CCMR0081]